MSVGNPGITVTITAPAYLLGSIQPLGHAVLAMRPRPRWVAAEQGYAAITVVLDLERVLELLEQSPHNIGGMGVADSTS